MSALVLAGAALALLPQTTARSAEPFDRHVRTLRAERTQRFYGAWRAAGAEARQRAADALDEQRSPGAPQGARPSLGALSLARRALAGDAAPADGGVAELRACADALDLMVVSGAFAARAEGRGEVLTVRVYPVYPAEPPGDVVVSLWWTAPDGGASRARRESVARAAFARPGFDMFVEAPASAPGLWTLEPRLEWGPESGDAPAVAAGAPVPVPCVPDPGARTAALAARIEGADAGVRHRVASVHRLLGYGLRTPRTPALGEELAFLELAVGRATPAGVEAPSGPALRALCVPDGAAAPWGWAAVPDARPRAALVLLTPSQESALAPFAPGAGWGRLATELDVAVLSAPAGLESGSRPADRVARARELWPDVPVVLVARGDAATHLRLSLLTAGAPGADALVVCGDSRAPHRGLPQGPALFVHVPSADLPAEGSRADASATGPDGGPRRVFAVGGPSAFLSESELVERVAEWLPSVVALSAR